MTPQGMETDPAKTAGLGAKHDSPVPAGDAPDHPTATDWQNRCERAEAECKELRKAMERLANIYPGWTSERIALVRNIARNALNGS